CGLQPFPPPNARDSRQRRTGSNLAGRFPDETPQTAQPDSRSKLIVRPGSGSPMVTDDYRGLPKGRVRPVFGKTPLPASRMGQRAAPRFKGAAESIRMERSSLPKHPSKGVRKATLRRKPWLTQ